MKSLASLLLILALCLWPVEMIFARLDDADIEDMRDDDGDEEGGENEAEQDSDGDGASDTEEAETSAANAAEVSEAASAAGLSSSDIGEIGSINTTEDANVPNDGVSIGGTTMTKDQALEAIKSIAEAKSKGIGASKDPKVPGIDVQATLAAHAQGERGVVVGSITGEIDTPEVIAHKEIDAAVSIKNVSSAASLSTSPTSGYVNGAKNVSDAVLSAAYNQAAKSMTQAGVLSISGRTKQVTAYQELARTGTAAGITNIGGTTNTIYSYDPNTNKFTGQQNGMSFDKIPGAAGVELDKTFTDILSKAGNESTITVDLNKGVTSVTNVRTGLVTNYTNETGNFVAPSLNSPLFSSSMTPGAPNTFTPVTGAINLFQGVPINAISRAQRAEQLDAMNLVTVGELDINIRNKIKNGEPLTADEMAAVMAVHGSLANRAAATNQTYATFAHQNKIIESISVNELAYKNWNALTKEQQTNVQNFNENLMSGNFYTGKAGFNSYPTTEAVTLPNATHFHAVDKTPKGWSIATDQPNATLGGHVVGQVYLGGSNTQLEYGNKMIGLKESVYEVATVAPTSYDTIVSISKNKNSGIASSQLSPQVTGTVKFEGEASDSEVGGVLNNEETPSGYFRVHPVNGGPSCGDTGMCNSPLVGGRLRDPKNPLGVGKNVHRGTDIYGKDFIVDRKVVSVSAGTVVNVKHNSQGYGTYIEIKDEVTGVISRYAHIEERPGIKVGDKVKAGEEIAKISGAGTAFDKLVKGNMATRNISKDEAFELTIKQQQARTAGWSVTPPHLHYEERTCVGCNYGEGLLDSSKSLGYEKGKTYEGGTPISSAGKNQGITANPNRSDSPTPNKESTSATEPGNSSRNPSINSRDVGRTTGQVVGGAVAGPIGSIIGGVLGERLARDINIDLGSGRGNLNGSDRKTNDSPDYDGDSCSKEDATSTCPQSHKVQEQSQSFTQKATSAIKQAFNTVWSPSPRVANNAKKEAPQVPSMAPEAIATVNITIDDQNGLVRLTRDDIVKELAENGDSYKVYERDAVLEVLNEVPLVFDDEGNIVYSNGLYSAPIEEGVAVEVPAEEKVKYVYVVNHIDKNGQITNVSNNSEVLPESFATKFIKDLFTSNAPFNTEDIDKVTYRLVNPKAEVPSDEYYDYVIVLKDGSYRATTVPQFTSIAFMASRFKDVGYQGEVMDLLNGAEETTEQAIGQNILKKLVDTVKDWAGKFMEAIGVTNDEKLPEEFANLPGFNSGVTSADIRSVFIYPNATVECPDIPDYNKGYAYVAVINSRDNENHLTTITTGRCGTGDIATLVTETAKNLAEEYGISDVTYDSIKDKTFIRGEQIFYTPSIVEIDISPTTPKPNESAETPIPQDDEGKPLFIPNTTNTLKMEVKAVDSKGQVISDWKQVESIELASGTQLFFRWNGSDYQQCLPFLQDGGNYALTRQDRTMLNGNTETEGYNVTERNGTYRVECGGQKNNEYGVDERKVEVLIK